MRRSREWMRLPVRYPFSVPRSHPRVRFWRWLNLGSRLRSTGPTRASSALTSPPQICYPKDVVKYFPGSLPDSHRATKGSSGISGTASNPFRLGKEFPFAKPLWHKGLRVLPMAIGSRLGAHCFAVDRLRTTRRPPPARLSFQRLAVALRQTLMLSSPSRHFRMDH